MNVHLDEEERQMMLMALAHLAVERPGWEDALARTAVKMDDIKEGRPTLYDNYRTLRWKALQEK